MAEGRRHTRVLPILVDGRRCRSVAVDGHGVPTQVRIVSKKAHFVTPVTGQPPVVVGGEAVKNLGESQ